MPKCNYIIVDLTEYQIIGVDKEYKELQQYTKEEAEAEAKRLASVFPEHLFVCAEMGMGCISYS
jgi:hypothetical protein